MMNTIKRTLPNRLLPWAIAVTYATFLVYDVLADQVAGVRLPDNMRMGLRFSGYFAIFCCLLYGGYRVIAAFPPSQPSYFNWLVATPWQHGTAFPVGPLYMRFYWTDVIVPTILIVTQWRNPEIRVVWLIGALLIGYLGLLTIVLGVTRQKESCYAMVMAFGLVIVACIKIGAFAGLVVLVLMYGFAVFAQNRMFQFYPWDTSAKMLRTFGTNFEKRSESTRKNQDVSFMRTDFSFAGPQNVDTIGFVDSVGVSILLGWWTFVVMLIGHAASSDSLATMWFHLIPFVGPFLRLMTYVGVGRPPIGLFGRLATGNWIVPGYDRVFINPMIGCLVAVLMLWGGSAMGMASELYVPVSVAVVTWIAISGKPTYWEWRLTGQHSRHTFGQKM